MGHHQMCGERNRLAPASLVAVLAFSYLTACTATAPTLNGWQQADASRHAVSSRGSGAPALNQRSNQFGSDTRRGIGVATKTNLELSGRASAAQANDSSPAPVPSTELDNTTSRKF